MLVQSPGRGALAALVAFAVVGALGGTTAAASSLPDDRRWELVSDPDKRGADVLVSSWRTQAADDGDAFRYAALAGFADTESVAIGTDYLSVRSHDPDPKSNGWTTHGITAKQRAVPLADLIGFHEPHYVGSLSGDLGTGVFFARSPLTEVPAVGDVSNLYRRANLRDPGAGAYTLLTGCPLCDATRTVLPPQVGAFTQFERPLLAGASSDFESGAFESTQRLTTDAPPEPAGCQHNVLVLALNCPPLLYEWDHGAVYLAGVLPGGAAAIASVAGQGVRAGGRTPHVVSDGSDGHSRVFFTAPTNRSGRPITQVLAQAQGNVFVRVDHAVTEQLNLSERSGASAYAPARFLDASADGKRAFFMTAQALTDDAPDDGLQKIYLYDASNPGSDLHNLTWVNASADPGAANVVGVTGASSDGKYLYFVASGGISVWHAGAVRFIAPSFIGAKRGELLGAGFFWTTATNQTRMTPDGRFLLFPGRSSALTGYDHGTCGDDSCRELYVYSADSGSVVCASCNPTGAPATGNATLDFGGNMIGGTVIEPVNNRAIASDGSRVFFSSPEALVADDTNGKSDPYQYDVRTGRVSLLSSGRSTSDSYFLNSSAEGRDAFILTRERLVGWDVDDAYDVYDARVGGGFPEPPAAPVPCSDDACQGLPAGGIGAYVSKGSAGFTGGGDLLAGRPAHRRCARGRVLRKVRGERRCVKRRRVVRRVVHRKGAGARDQRRAP